MNGGKSTDMMELYHILNYGFVALRGASSLS